MIGKLFITSSGYDPAAGKHIKDPYLGKDPSLGICRPNVRKKVQTGDWIFLISGRVPAVQQYVVGGFEVAGKVHATEAFKLFPERRLRLLPDGQTDGNIIVNGRGEQHRLDHHDGFERRADHYVLGRNPIVLERPKEVELARAMTHEFLCELFDSTAPSPFRIIGRGARTLDERQIRKLVEWLDSIRRAA